MTLHIVHVRKGSFDHNGQLPAELLCHTCRACVELLVVFKSKLNIANFKQPETFFICVCMWGGGVMFLFGRMWSCSVSPCHDIEGITFNELDTKVTSVSCTDTHLWTDWRSTHMSVFVCDWYIWIWGYSYSYKPHNLLCPWRDLFTPLSLVCDYIDSLWWNWSAEALRPITPKGTWVFTRWEK